MSYRIVQKHKKTAAGIAAMLVLVFVLFSAFYIAAETGHDCTGEDCPVCACLQQCENTLHRIGGGTALLAAAVLPYFFMIVSASIFAYAFSKETPVQRKVRLNN